MATWPDSVDLLADMEIDNPNLSRVDAALAATNGWLAARCGIATDADPIPDAVHLAALMYASKLYRRKDSPDGVAGTNDFAGVIRTSRLDPDAEKLLELYLSTSLTIG